MSLELVNTLASLGTFVVIAATAIAALIQLRHARGSNQIAALAELRAAAETPQFREAEAFVTSRLAEKMKDPAFRYEIANREARTADTWAALAHVVALGNFYEHVGLLVKTAFVDRELALDLWGPGAHLQWDRLAPAVAIFRRRAGSQDVWDNFEYFTVLARQWAREHPNGTYPRGVERIAVPDEHAAEDAAYAASVASAPTQS